MRERHTRGDVSRSPKWRASSQAGGSCEESRESSTRKGSQVGRSSLARSHAGSLRSSGSPYKSELAHRLEISKISSLNLNLFLVTLEAGEAGVPTGSAHSSAWNESASEGSLTCALNLHSTFLRVKGVIKISTNKRRNRLKFLCIYLHWLLLHKDSLWIDYLLPTKEKQTRKTSQGKWKRITRISIAKNLYQRQTQLVKLDVALSRISTL